MRKLVFSLLISVGVNLCSAQQTLYDVTVGNGNGIRFWQSDSYKIHMGNLPEYHYGPVTDYSIKMNMDLTTGRGWTWGTQGATPIAAIGNQGNMQIAGTFSTGGDIQISNASIPMGFATEVGGTTPLLNMNINFRGSNVNSTYHGASFRIDTRTDSQLFQWLARPAGVAQGGVGENILMVLTESGYVGIGTTSPDAKLAVSGQVHAQEVKVSITVPGPDYVFEDDYQLTSLEEIEAYIDQNKHLPEVPSAKEMEKNGVQLGEMNMLLLKKIEELTLHLIEQQQQINTLQAEVSLLKK